MKRKWFGVLALVISVVIGASCAFLPVKESGISQANCDKIQLGWDLEQVAELLGDEPPGCSQRLSHWSEYTDQNGFSGWGWRDEDGNGILVFYDYKLGITSKKFVPTELSFLERTRRRIERRLRALWPLGVAV